MEKYGIDKETNDRLNKTAFQVALAYQTTRSKAQTPETFLFDIIHAMATIKTTLADVSIRQEGDDVLLNL